MPFLILIPLLMAVILYWMTGLGNTAEQFFIFYFIFFLVSFAGNSLGLLIGCMVSDVKLVTVLMPIVILPFILFSGFYKNRNDLPVWLFWIEYISPLKYSFISFCRNELNQYSNDQLPLTFLNFEEHMKGAKFAEITKDSEMYEGSIIRMMRQLEETLRQIAAATRVIGDEDLYNRFMQAIQLMRRDIVFANSLYI